MGGGKFGENRFGGRLDFTFTTHIARNGKCRRTDFCRCRISRGLVQIDTGDVRSCFCECKRYCATDTVARAGNDSGFARERIFPGERHLRDRWCRNAAKIGLLHARIGLQLRAGTTGDH